MNSRERVFAALEHRQPDRCPVDFWVEDATRKTLLDYFGFTDEQQLIEKFEVDLQFVFPDSKLPAPVMLPDGSWYDETGARRRLQKTTACEYTEWMSYPLAEAETVDDLLKYDKWPDAAMSDWDSYSDKIGDLHKKRVIKLHTGGLYERAWLLTGQEKFLEDMIENPDIPHFIMGKLCDYWCEYVRRAMDAAGDKIDIVYTYDDIAAQNGLLMSPKMLDQFVYPYHRKLNAVIHSFGKRVLYHSCGSVITEIPKLMALPIDALNPLQPRARGMDFTFIKKTYGDKLSFHGGIDIQHTLPHGTPDEVQAEVKRAISILGQNGGYIMTSAHYIQNDTPIENILAMYDTSIR